MPSGAQTNRLERDKNITRFVHRLFFNAMLRDKKNLAIAMLHFPSFFLFNAYIPLQVAYILQAIFQRQFDAYYFNIYMIAGAALVGGAFMYIANQADSRMGINGAAYLQKQAFSNFLHKDYDFYSSQYVGSLGTQVSNLRDAFLQYVHEFKFVIEKNTTIVVSILIVLAYKSLVLFGASLIIISIILSYTYYANKKRMELRRASSEASNDLAGIEADAISHGAAVKSFAAEDFEINYSQKVSRVWQKAQLKTWFSLEPSNTIRVLLSQATIVLLLIITAILHENNTISIAIVVLVQIYMFRLINVSLDLAEIIKQYEHIMGLAYKPAQTMQIKQTIIDPDSPKHLPETPKIVSFQNVTYNYNDNSNENAVGNFDLNLNSGEKVGLIGYSGAGKTTITKLILRFMDVQKGSIKIDSIDIREVPQYELRQKISYVPQEPLLFHRSIRENIAYGRPEATDKEIEKAAKLAYVDEFVSRLPGKYETLVGERGVKLSGGQRQRVVIARAILKDAPILVLDEATSSLDSQSEKYIQDALWKLMKERTALVIAHRLSTIQRMEKIVVMDKGKIVQIGTHKKLLKQKGIYGELWRHQSGGYIGNDDEES
ncbi:ABC transporter ATP-binding protein/permease [Candidatus Parcubacteria bacterium]|nr:ABC transporter ATP-binding protein/permease [Candidatus Parcubacteria bacterium]